MFFSKKRKEKMKELKPGWIIKLNDGMKVKITDIRKTEADMKMVGLTHKPQRETFFTVSYTTQDGGKPIKGEQTFRSNESAIVVYDGKAKKIGLRAVFAVATVALSAGMAVGILLARHIAGI